MRFPVIFLLHTLLNCLNFLPWVYTTVYQEMTGLFKDFRLENFQFRYPQNKNVSFTLTLHFGPIQWNWGFPFPPQFVHCQQIPDIIFKKLRYKEGKKERRKGRKVNSMNPTVPMLIKYNKIPLLIYFKHYTIKSDLKNTCYIPVG